jgi:hypothetical protein
MPREPSTVWMVHKATGQAGVRGDLMLTGEHLVFRPELAAAKIDSLGETVVAIAEIGKVRRSRRSPVLELHVTTPGLPEVLLFYFVKPPDMYSSGLPNPRAAVATYLATSNAIYEDEVKEWAQAIAEARPGR